jgi:hypothetical protein
MWGAVATQAVGAPSASCKNDSRQASRCACGGLNWSGRPIFPTALSPLLRFHHLLPGLQSESETKQKEYDDAVGAQPRRFALRFSPPTLIVEFSVGVGVKRKVYHQRIFLKALSSTSVRALMGALLCSIACMWCTILQLWPLRGLVGRGGVTGPGVLYFGVGRMPKNALPPAAPDHVLGAAVRVLRPHPRSLPRHGCCYWQRLLWAQAVPVFCAVDWTATCRQVAVASSHSTPPPPAQHAHDTRPWPCPCPPPPGLRYGALLVAQLECAEGVCKAAPKVPQAAAS